MSLANFKTDKTIKQQGDSLGGYILESGTVDMVIEMAYVAESAKGATSINFMFVGKDGKSLRAVIYISSGFAKGQKHTYTDKDGNEQYLPGFSQVNSICVLSIGKELAAINTEKKTISVYDPKVKKETPQERDVMMELLGTEITLGVIKQLVAVNELNDDGVYRPKFVDGVLQTREENEIDKAFRTKDGLTLTELGAEATEAAFKSRWEKKNAGETRDKTKNIKAPTALPGMPGSTSSGETKKLF